MKYEKQKNINKKLEIKMEEQKRKNKKGKIKNYPVMLCV